MSGEVALLSTGFNSLLHTPQFGSLILCVRPNTPSPLTSLFLPSVLTLSMTGERACHYQSHVFISFLIADLIIISLLTHLCVSYECVMACLLLVYVLHGKLDQMLHTYTLCFPVYTGTNCGVRREIPDKSSGSVGLAEPSLPLFNFFFVVNLKTTPPSSLLPCFHSNTHQARKEYRTVDLRYSKQ